MRIISKFSLSAVAIFTFCIVLGLAHTAMGKSKYTRKEDLKLRTIKFYVNTDAMPEKAFVPLAKLKFQNKKTKYYVRRSMSRKVLELGGHAVTNFTCTDAGIDVAQLVIVGISGHMVENCYGVAIRWAAAGEKGQTIIKGKENIPTYELE
jgi:hypothetical protein